MKVCIIVILFILDYYGLPLNYWVYSEMKLIDIFTNLTNKIKDRV